MLQTTGDVETRKNRAIECWRKQQGLEMGLYRLYVANINLKDNSEYSLEDFRRMKKEFARNNPANPSLSNTIGLIDKVYYETLYQANPKRAQSTLENRAVGEWTTYLLLFASVLSASFGPTVGAALILTIFSPILFVGSALYLGQSIYDYFNTPKSQRTPLQKFNMLSSIPSTLLVGLFINAAMASFFVPAAFLMTLAIGAAWFGYKIWQANKGSSIKWAEYKNREKELDAINIELEYLKQEPTIQNEVERLEASDKLEKLRSNPSYIKQRLIEEELQHQLIKLNSTQMPSTYKNSFLVSNSLFNHGVQQQPRQEEAYAPKMI